MRKNVESKRYDNRRETREKRAVVKLTMAKIRMDDSEVWYCRRSSGAVEKGVASGSKGNENHRSDGDQESQ
jgi:hypothetical protein